jgi:putative ABC transport system permease protein
VAVQEAVGDVARAGPIAFRGDQLQQLLASANASFSVGTVVALFVGAFLVYNTMAMAAVERLQEAALLRAVGARRRQVFALFLAEGGLLGLVGSALGIALGLLLSTQMLSQQGSAIEEIFPIQITKLAVSPQVLVGAGIAGVVASIAAAYLPARRIARADVAPALGPTGTLEDPTHRSRRAMTAIGIVCAIAGPILSVLSVGTATEATPVTILGFAITLTGIALLIPTGVPFLAGIVLGSLAKRRSTPRILRLAAGEVLRSPGRTSYTVGAVLLSLALVVGFSIAQSSFKRAFDAEFENIISADVYVRSPTWRPFGSDVPIDHRLAADIEQVDGVKAAWPFRFMPVTYEGRSLAVLAYDLEKYGRHSRVDSAAKREFAAQAAAVGDRRAVLASSSLLSQFQLDVGDEIELSTPTGKHALELAASFDDPSAITPEVIFDHAMFTKLWGTGGADSFVVVLDDPSNEAVMIERIGERVGEQFGLVVNTRQEYFDILSDAVNSVVQLIGSVQLVAVIVAGLGLANTLLISTFERRRDFGVLRSVGMLRRQLRRMVAAEALIIGLLGVVLAWGLGTLIGVGMFLMIEAQLGVPLKVAFPLLGYIGAAILGLAAAFLASIYPAQRAARLDVVAALAYE